MTFAETLSDLTVAQSVFSLPLSAARAGPDLTAIDACILPYVSGNNFSGSVLIKKNATVIFEKSYGLANRETNLRNSATTRFHIASVSMQFTAAAILRLIDQGSLSLDTRLDTLIPEIQDAAKITIRDLLAQRSGLPDINDQPNYNDILSRHQTPESLIAPIKGRPLLFEPGTKYLHEEHSAYNVLARIIEIKTNLPFASAIEKLVFRPAGLSSSAVDDDSTIPSLAQGYQPEGVYDLKPAAAFIGPPNPATPPSSPRRAMKRVSSTPFLLETFSLPLRATPFWTLRNGSATDGSAAPTNALTKRLTT